MEDQRLLPASDKSYSETIGALLSESAPNVLSRSIEVGSDYAEMVLLSGYDPRFMAANTLIVSSKMILRSLNAVVLFYISPLTKAKEKTKALGGIIQSGWTLALLLSAPSVLMAAFSNSIFKFLGQPSDTSDLVHRYLLGFSWGIPSTLMLVANQQLMLGLSRPWLVFAITALTRLPALALGYNLMKDYGFGLAGMGYAYSAASATAFLLGLFAFKTKGFKSYGIFQKPSKEEFRETFILISQKGFPIGGYALTELGSSIMTSILLGTKGNTNLKLFQAALQTSSVIANLTFAIGVTTGIKVKEALGNNNRVTAKRYGISSHLICAFLPVLAILIYIINSSVLVKPFISNNASGQELNSASQFLIINLVGGLFDAVLRNSATGALRGYGETVLPMKANIAAMLCVKLPLALLFTFFFYQPNLVVAARNIAILISGAAIFFKLMKMAKVEEANSQQNTDSPNCYSFLTSFCSSTNNNEGASYARIP